MYHPVIAHKVDILSTLFWFKIHNPLYGLVICYFPVSKRFGVEPPGLIKLEKEIEQEETLSAPLPSPSPSPTKSPGKKSTGKLLDDAVSCGREFLLSYPSWCALTCRTHTSLSFTAHSVWNIGRLRELFGFLSTIIYVWSLAKKDKCLCVGAVQPWPALCWGPHSLLIAPLLLIHQLPLGALSESGQGLAPADCTGCQQTLLRYFRRIFMLFCMILT